MQEIKKIEAGSLAKTVATILGSIMVIVGIFWVVMAIVAGIIRSAYGTTPYAGTGIGYSVGFGLIILIFGTVIGAVIGFILGALIATVYNMVASRFGGLKLGLESPASNSPVKNNKKK